MIINDYQPSLIFMMITPAFSIAHKTTKTFPSNHFVYRCVRTVKCMQTDQGQCHCFRVDPLTTEINSKLIVLFNSKETSVSTIKNLSLLIVHAGYQFFLTLSGFVLVSVKAHPLPIIGDCLVLDMVFFFAQTIRFCLPF